MYGINEHERNSVSKRIFSLTFFARYVYPLLHENEWDKHLNKKLDDERNTQYSEMHIVGINVSKNTAEILSSHKKGIALSLA